MEEVKNTEELKNNVTPSEGYDDRSYSEEESFMSQKKKPIRP